MGLIGKFIDNVFSKKDKCRVTTVTVTNGPTEAECRKERNRKTPVGDNPSEWGSGRAQGNGP